jgi:molybdate transport system substrate-binding protein
MRRAAPVLLAVATACAGAGCGGGGGRELIVSAASSLRPALTIYGGRFTPAHVRFSFAGSDQLAAQIRQGARPDVFAAADTKLPGSLYRAGLVRRPVSFARNRLVVAVRQGRRDLRSIADLGRRGVTVALGSPSVPVGAYARQLILRLPRAEREAILANVRSTEPDVAGVVAKVSERAVDAGLVYATDARASGGRVLTVGIPAALQPDVAYSAAVVRDAPHPAAARAFVRGLLRGPGAAALRAAGFLPPAAR